MKNIFLVCPSNFYYNNRIFDLTSPYNRDNAWHPMYILKETFKKNNIELNTYDFLEKRNLCIDEKKDFLIFSDIPKNFNYYLQKFRKIDKYLIVMESIFINKDNGNKNYHKYFKKIFTYQDDLIDNKKYFKTNYSFDVPKNINKDLSKKENLCTLIAGYKTDTHSQEIYSKRIEAIKWFEKFHPEKFDLYGIGWDTAGTAFNAPKLFKLMRKFNIFKKSIEKKYTLNAPKFISYKGKIERKKNILEKYKFCICYENFKDVPGWITEKIFDCFFAGCIPVYWGANNITDHIPENCFIDKRNFNSYEELYSFLVQMKDNNYLGYLNNIENYLKSEKIYQFSSQYFAETIVNEIIKI